MREQEIYIEAMNRQDPADRRQFLNEACGKDRTLRDRLEKLMLHSERVGDFLENPPQPLTMTADVSCAAEQPDTYIGPYKLIEEIGAGGMGTVFMALQKKPVRRSVALKVIKAGMDSKQVVSRFEAERQALAMMDHPNIAKVLDGGTTESDRPYFVMELVKGIPITDYCDGHRLANNERLELFRDVCSAVHHAHQKGIIHRDLKPSNILVAQLDDKPLPKIIDFGIAKAMSGRLMDESFVTAVSQVVGTPMYMSPEQAELTATDVDTRSDVYSLGVLLYELLTGTTPFDGERMSSISFDEFRRIVREEEPPRPSTRLSTLDAALETVADKHNTDPRTLSQQVNGELDWIVMKALEKDRSRRYESANELAKDVQRYLNDDPVEACPPSTGYRLKKLLRRHKAAVLAASVVFVALMVTVGMALTLAVRERQAAQRRLFVQHGINGVLTEVARLRGQVSATALGDQTALTQAREQMQRALALVDAGPAETHLIAQVRQLASELDQEQQDRQLLSALDEAWLAEPSLSWDRRFANENSVPLLRNALTADGLAVGQGDPRAAAAKIKSRQENVRSEIVAALYEWHSLLSPPIGIILEDNRDFDVVAYVSPESPAGRDGRLKPKDRIVGIGQGRGASVTSTTGMTVRQIMQLLRGDPGTIVQLEVLPAAAKESRTLEIQRDTTAAWLWAVIHAADPDPWRRRVREACELEDDTLRRAELEKLADAADLARQPVRFLTRLGAELARVKSIDRATIFLKKVWQEYPDDVSTNISLAVCLRQHQPPKTEESLRYYTAVITVRPESALLRNMRGVVFHKSGKLEEAIADYREAIRLKPDSAKVHGNLGLAFSWQGKLDEAIAEYRDAIRLQPDYPAAHFNLANILRGQGKLEKAVAEYRETVRLDPASAEARNSLAWLLAVSADPKLRQPQEAMDHAMKAVELMPKNGSLWNTLGVARYRNGKWKEAINALAESCELSSGGTACDWLYLAMAHWQLGNKEEARRHYDKSVEWIEKNKQVDAELERFRTEAAELLGIAEEPDQTDTPGVSGEKENAPTKGAEEKPNGEGRQDE